MSSERETDRLEIIELTQTLSQERRKRDVEKQLIDELKQQVKVAQINYVSRNQLHCTANLNFGFVKKQNIVGLCQPTFHFCSADIFS